MSFGNISPRRQTGIRFSINSCQNVIFLLVGICFGFWSSSFLSTFTIMSLPKHISLLNQMQDNNNMNNNTIIKKNDSMGWNTIHVFYGNTSHIGEASHISKNTATILLNSNNNNKTKRWFAQVRQDEIVSRLLRNKQNGYFVDLAANDAIRISNTYALETYHGWQGLCLEANSIYWAGLAYRPGCTIIAAVVGQQMMDEVRFRFPNRAPPKGGIVGSSFDNHETSRYGEDQLRYTVTLSHILERFQAPVVMDYLSLDVEGAETFVMSTFPFDRYRFNVLTIERPDNELCHLLIQNGYRLLKQLKKWGETIWVHELADDLDLSVLDMDTENFEYSENE